jgi:short-subunit dehydrogenase
MNIQSTDTVLITGASGGLGTYIVRAFARHGVRLALAAYPGNELEELRAEVEKQRCECITQVADLRKPGERQQLIETILKRFGRVDILVNNAGIEFTSYYHELSEVNILDVLNINLEAPMILTWLLLPQMLKHRRGHVINISSLAGKSGPAFQEPYSATKAGLIAFTASLRATYQDSGVSSSVIVPGFVEAGIYARLKARTGSSAPPWLGTSSPNSVALAVLRAIERNIPEVIVNPLPVRPLLAFMTLFPSAGERLINKIGSNKFFQLAVSIDKFGQTGNRGDF